MKMSIWSLMVKFVLVMLMLSSCTSNIVIEPTITVTPLPTKTKVPTQTPIPPTATIQAPDKTLEFLNGVSVVYLDTFDDPARGGWGFDAGTVKNGVLEVIGKNWNGLVRDRDFKDNQGIIVDFTYTDDSLFEMLMDTGEWNTDPYKRFGVYFENDAPKVNVWVKNNPLGGAYLSGNFRLRPNTNYTTLMALLPDGGFLSIIWDPSDPSKTVFYREIVGKNWTGLTWKFRIGAANGIILFDNYREIIFDSAK